MCQRIPRSSEDEEETTLQIAASQGSSHTGVRTAGSDVETLDRSDSLDEAAHAEAETETDRHNLEQLEIDVEMGDKSDSESFKIVQKRRRAKPVGPHEPEHEASKSRHDETCGSTHANSATKSHSTNQPNQVQNETSQDSSASHPKSPNVAESGDDLSSIVFDNWSWKCCSNGRCTRVEGDNEVATGGPETFRHTWALPVCPPGLPPAPPETRNLDAQNRVPGVQGQRDDKLVVLRGELDHVKALLNASTAREADQVQLIASLQDQLRIMQSRNYQSRSFRRGARIDSLEDISGSETEPRRVVAPPGLDRQPETEPCWVVAPPGLGRQLSASSLEPVKVKLAPSLCEPLYVPLLGVSNCLSLEQDCSVEDDSASSSISTAYCYSDMGSCEERRDSFH